MSDRREAAQLESGIEHSAACLDGDSSPALLPGGPSISRGEPAEVLSLGRSLGRRCSSSSSWRPLGAEGCSAATAGPSS